MNGVGSGIMASKTSSSPSLDKLASELVQINLATVREEAASEDEFAAVDYLVDIVREHGGRWAPLQEMEGHSALLRAVRRVI